MKSVIAQTALFTLLALPFAATAHAAPETYNFESNHTSVTWHTNHLGFSNLNGKFTGITGNLVLDEANPAASSLEAVIDINSISTGLPKFDAHLKSADLFNAEKFPTATFKSTKVTLKGEKEALVEGNLTLMGVTKPVTLEVELNKIAPNPMSQVKTAGFSAEAKIKRSEFGMNYALPAVPDEVELDIEVEANPAAAK